MIAVALFDFTGEEDNSLSFKKGDAIEVINRDNSGWWDGSCNGRRGWFPSTYVSLDKMPPKISTARFSRISSPLSAQRDFRSATTPQDSGYLGDFSVASSQNLPRKLSISSVDSFFSNEKGSLMSPVPQMTPTIKFNRGRNDSISNWNWPLLLSRVNDICYDLTEATNTRSKDGLALGMDRMNLCVQSMFAIVDPILDTLDESAVSSIEIRQRKKRVVAEWSTLMGVSKELMINPTVSDLQMLMVSTIDEISEVIREFIEEIRDSNFINDPSRKGSRDKSAASLFALTSPPANAHPLDFYISLVHDMNKYTQMGKLLQAEKMYQSFLKESDNLNGYLERMNWFNVTPNRRDALKAMRTEVQDMVKAFLFETRISQGMYNVPSVLEAVTGLELTLRNFKSELVSSEQFSKTTSPVSPVSNEATTRRLHISPIMTQDPKWGSESKIKKLLGENPLVSPVSHASPRISRFLGRDYGDEIFFDTNGKVKAGSIRALVEQMTMHNALDLDFNTTFLTTYKLFMTSSELFAELRHRFNIRPPAEIGTEERATWKEKKLQPIQICIFNVIKTWIEQYLDMDDTEDAKVLDMVEIFCQKVMSQALSKASDQLLRIVAKKRARTDDTVLQSSCPAPILPKSMDRIRFLEMDPLELARQLTLMHARTFKRIKPEEFLLKMWINPKAKHRNIRNVIGLTDQIASWVSYTILLEKSLDKRIQILKHFILIAEKCSEMSNFLTTNAILAGLSAETIRRLSSTWEGLPPRVHKVFIQLSSVVSPAQKYLEYRKALQLRQFPALPLLPCHLADLGWILSQHAVTLDSGHINWTFMTLISGIVQEMSQFQKTEFALHSVHALQLYLKSMFKDGADEVTRIKMSYALEADKERRLKQDMTSVSQALKSSGFF